ncbi:MAG: GDSL-type esterase/lipase family protein [Firmicutes bacterium]|nr:GDSL-type esterase/lipase family protein [Bacillota bacterium]
MKDINILVFGDSIVYGLYDYKHLGWCERLKNYYINDQDHTICTYNLGIPGNTSFDLINIIENEISFRRSDDMIIVLSAGINDSQLVDHIDRYSIEQFEDNIKKLINIAKKYTDKILYVGLTKVDEKRCDPVSFNKHKAYKNAKIMAYDRVINDCCNKMNITYLKVYDLLDNIDLYDGLHPNETGHQKLFNEIKIVLNKMIL